MLARLEHGQLASLTDAAVNLPVRADEARRGERSSPERYEQREVGNHGSVVQAWTQATRHCESSNLELRFLSGG